MSPIHEPNTRLTRAYLPRVDAAIFIFSADPPLTAMKQEFLRTTLPLIPYIEFVLNKKDYLHEVLKDLIGEELYISANSALPGFRERMSPTPVGNNNSGLPQLEERLQHFLFSHRGKYIVLDSMERIERICGEWKNLLKLERQARTFSLEQLNQNLEKFKEYMSAIRRKSEGLQFLLFGIQSRLLQEWDQEIPYFIQESAPKHQ